MLIEGDCNEEGYFGKGRVGRIIKIDDTEEEQFKSFSP